MAINQCIHQNCPQAIAEVVPGRADGVPYVADSSEGVGVRLLLSLLVGLLNVPVVIRDWEKDALRVGQAGRSEWRSGCEEKALET